MLAGEERIWHFAHRPRANCPKAVRTESCSQALPIQSLRPTPGAIPICFINLLAKLTFLVILSEWRRTLRTANCPMSKLWSRTERSELPLPPTKEL